MARPGSPTTLQLWHFGHRVERRFLMVNYLAGVELKKRIYGQAFTVYSRSEYHGATGDEGGFAKTRDTLLRLLSLLSCTAVTSKPTSAVDACRRSRRLSEVDMDAKKSMNTHLHLRWRCVFMDFFASMSTLLRRLSSRERPIALVGFEMTPMDGHRNWRTQ